MKRVAVIMESWKSWFTYAWPSGMYQKLKEIDADVNLYIFNSSANWSSDASYNAGEYNIFQLPDFRDYDGILLDLNNVTDEKVRQDLLERVRSSGVPAIVIANQYDGFYSVGVDNYHAMMQVLEHLGNVHQCKSFWFLMGPEGHYENMRRMQAVEDYIAAHQILDYTFQYADFDCKSGEESFERLWKERGVLPDAVVCANDNLAVGALTAAERHGWKAPENFLITGFDDLDKSRYYNPRISTVSYVREEIGYAAMEMFLDIWDGKQVEPFRYTTWRTIFWDSCGCVSDVQVDMRKRLKDTIVHNEDMQVFKENILALNDRLIYCNDVQEMMECIPQCVPSLKCDAMYLVSDEHLVEVEETVVIEQDMSLDLMKSPFVTEGYPKHMRVVFAYEDQQKVRSNVRQQTVQGIFPMFDCEESGVNFLFIPLHFRDKCVGYFAIRNAIYLMEQQFLFDIINSLTKGLEQLYARGQLARMNYVLSALYTRDAMTMLYNRLGLVEYGDRYLLRQHIAGNPVSVTFIDLDRLKYINDTYGHEAGDFAIKKVAEVIMQHVGEQGYAFRLGGDEFLMLEAGCDVETQEQRCMEIQQELTRISQQEQCPVELTMSYGCVQTVPGENKVLDDYIKEADDKMYQYKVAHKRQRTN